MKTNEELFDEAMEFYDESNYFDAMLLLQISADAVFNNRPLHGVNACQ